MIKKKWSTKADPVSQFYDELFKKFADESGIIGVEGLQKISKDLNLDMNTDVFTTKKTNRSKY